MQDSERVTIHHLYSTMAFLLAVIYILVQGKIEGISFPLYCHLSTVHGNKQILKQIEIVQQSNMLVTSFADCYESL